MIDERELQLRRLAEQLESDLRRKHVNNESVDLTQISPSLALICIGVVYIAAKYFGLV